MPRFGARLGLAAAWLILALVVAMIAVGFLGAAIFFELEAKELSPPAAAAIVGGGGLVLAALFGIVARRVLCPAAPPAVARSHNTVDDAAADLGALVAQQIVNTTREHPYGTVGAALAAGFAVGAVPELRKALTELFKH